MALTFAANKGGVIIDDAQLSTHLEFMGGRGRSSLAELTTEQRERLSSWSALQPQRNGTVDLTNWPGWAGIDPTTLN
jgi:hypothetical protein